MASNQSANELPQRQQEGAAFTASNPFQYMAGQQAQGNQQINPYLSANQQDLLLAALNSQAGGRQDTQPQAGNSGVLKQSSTDSPIQTADMNGVNENALFMSPQQAEFGNLNGDFTPDLDYLDDDFDFENADLGGEMIGSLPGGSMDDFNGTDLHDKRKNSDEYDTGEEGDPKRQELGDGERGAKKPGRKPLTSEPTTKRKAQNRAAQRAFRERKEKHLKDLETTVGEMKKSQQADKHENGLLKAKIERMQVELREYRKRLSLNGGSGANKSPPLTASGGHPRSNSNPLSQGNNFQFEFPKFGALPGSQIFGNQGFSNSNPSLAQSNSLTPPSSRSPTTNGSFNVSQPTQDSRENSSGRSMSPRSITGTTTGSPSQIASLNPAFTSYSTNDNMHGFASTLPQMGNTNNDPFGDLFSPSILKSASFDSNSNYFGNGNQVNPPVNASNGGDSTAGLNRAFQFNRGSSVSDSASPSASSASQWNGNANSSCGTSPEPSHGSPAHQPKNAETFCKEINPLKQSSPLATSNQTLNSNTQFGGTDYSVPSLDSFDPVLFGDYRDSNDAIIGGGDFTGGFFDEALNPPFDYASPSNLFGILQSPEQSNATLSAPSTTAAANAPTPSANLMAEIEKTRDGGDDDYGLPGSTSQNQNQMKKLDSSGKLISCNNIWNQLQSNPDFQEGKFDLDGLCSELRAKARCSESGVMVDQDHVDAALRKLGKKDDKTGKPVEAPAGLMFEQESWDNVLKKLGNKL